MEIQTLSSTPFITKNYISSDYTKAFNLPSLIESMKKSHKWANRELNATILLKGHNKQIILTSIHDGTEIESFQSKDSVTFHILEGKLKLNILYDTVILNAGQLMTITNKIKYYLSTEEDTVFLLTISESLTDSIRN
jgi:quercetin dioxygenase-like cupin family protein